MANIIRHKRSTVAGLSPVAPDLVTGELAVNAADGRLYTLLTSGNVVDVTIPIEVDGGRIVIPSIVVPAGYNSANYGANANWNTTIDGNVTNVGTNGGPSAYGTFDQSGNVFEWLQSGFVRGGSYASAFSALSSVSTARSPVGLAANEIGLRIATRANQLLLPDFVAVGDNNNEPNFNGVGSVAYDYYIAKYPVTYAQYVTFLQAIDELVGQPLPLIDNTPAAFDLLTAARYCNWLHNNYGDTETGAYTLTNYTAGEPLPARNAGAKYFIPTESEWYKAAYYKGGGAQRGYWRYATQSDAVPESVCATNIGNGTIICAGDRLLTADGDFLFTQLNDSLITAQDL